MRLNKFLASAGVASRRKCDELISGGHVFVNGKLVTELGVTVNERKDRVKVDGIEVSLPSSFVYIKLNKPKGYACTASDEKGRKTIYELVDSPVRLFSVGRLDYNTEGLIILTNDGEFANRIMHPKNKIEKEYRVNVEGQMKESELAVLRKGVVIDGERLPDARVNFMGCENGVTKLSIVIDEGQNHQIRRMFEGIGRDIKMLRRVRIGSVKLGGLKRGDYKDLTVDELNALAGGKR